MSSRRRAPPSSGTTPAPCMPWMRRKARSYGRLKWTPIRPRASWGRPRCTTTGCMSRWARTRKKIRRIPIMAAVPFAAASSQWISPADGSCGKATPCSRRRNPRTKTAPECRNSDLPEPRSLPPLPLIPSAACSTWAPVVPRRGSSSRSPMQSPHSTWATASCAGSSSSRFPAGWQPAASTARPSCARCPAATKFYWPARSRAWSTGSILTTAATSCGKPVSARRLREARELQWVPPPQREPNAAASPGAALPIIAACLSPSPGCLRSPATQREACGRSIPKPALPAGTHRRRRRPAPGARALARMPSRRRSQ